MLLSVDFVGHMWLLEITYNDRKGACVYIEKVMWHRSIILKLSTIAIGPFKSTSCCTLSVKLHAYISHCRECQAF